MSPSLILALAAAGVLASCSAPAATPVPVPPLPTPPAVAVASTLPVVGYTSPPKVTGRQRPACLARMRGQLPDPACTPGSVGTIDAAQVCVPRFASTRRPAVRYTEPAKTAAMLAYRMVPTDRKRIEYDHLVPLSLGGSNDVSNLWPQISDTSLVDEHNFKDEVELRAWRWVCGSSGDARRWRLVKIQEQFARDWTAVDAFMRQPPS